MIDDLMLNHLRIQEMRNDVAPYNPIYNDFKNNPAYRQMYSVTRNKYIDTHILDAGNVGNMPKRYMIPYKNDMMVSGELLLALNGSYWLCTAVNTALGYAKGFCSETNSTLRWLDNEDNLHDIPALVSSKTLYTTGIKDEDRILIPNGMIGIVVSNDGAVQNIGRGDEFIYNRNKYMVTYFDNTTIAGAVHITCEEKAQSKYDDIENRIANRYAEDGRDRLEDVEIPEPNREPIVTGQNEMYLGEVSTLQLLNVEVKPKSVYVEPDDYINVLDWTNKEIKLQANTELNIGLCDVFIELQNGGILSHEINITW